MCSENLENFLFLFVYFSTRNHSARIGKIRIFGIQHFWHEIAARKNWRKTVATNESSRGREKEKEKERGREIGGHGTRRSFLRRTIHGISTDWHPPSPAICQNRRGACHSSLYCAIVNVKEERGKRRRGGKRRRRRKKEKQKWRSRDSPKRKTKKRRGSTILSPPYRGASSPRGTARAPCRALRVLIWIERDYAGTTRGEQPFCIKMSIKEASGRPLHRSKIRLLIVDPCAPTFPRWSPREFLFSDLSQADSRLG